MRCGVCPWMEGSSEARDHDTCRPATSHRSERVVPIREAFYCRIASLYLYRFRGWILAGLVETTHTQQCVSTGPFYIDCK